MVLQAGVKMIADSYREMNNKRLDRVIRRVGNDVDGQMGYWQFEFKGRQLVVVTDESHNRMRVMTPVADESALTDEICRILLSANFDRALDAKYAVSQELLWSVFMHRLRELTDEQVIDAIEQVRLLADNYGGSYSSSNLVFGA